MPEQWRRGDLDSFLAEPVESYISPIVHDIALRSEATRAQTPRALTAALGDRYSVERVVGVGGMATVYLAQDHSLGRAVAVKVLHSALADSLGAERFVQEIEVTARLEHSRIVPVHERGEADGLLYFMMRYFEGGSLRQHIERQGQLPIPVAIAIARDVAQALDHAHARGVVHRDIKPANILLEGSTAFVADFGIAHLVDVAGPDRLTSKGVVVGTPEYMSPEQAEPGGRVDGRSDVYSLACVLYEMLAGEPPYTAHSRRDVLAKHASAAIPDLGVLRGTVTPAMRRVVTKALQKSPADRYATCGEFIADFEAATDEAPSKPRWVPQWMNDRVAAIAAMGVVVTSAAAMAATRPEIIGDVFAKLDSTSVAVLPFAYDSSFRGRIQERQVVGDAFRRWRGVSVVDEVRLGEAVAGRDAASVSKAGRSIARGLGAGRFVRGEVSQVRDSVRIYAALYETRGDRLIRDGTVRVTKALAALDSAGDDLVAQLLFPPADWVVRSRCLKTTSPDAYRGCTFAHEAIARWDLASADSALSLAGTSDPDFAHAHLWLAQVRTWRNQPADRWRSAAERAAIGENLDDRERLRARALAALSRRDMPGACGLWNELVTLTPDDYSAWYSLGMCLRSDNAVVPAPGTISGWRFRSSYHRALAAYRRAFELRPSMLLVFQEGLFAGVREMFVTDPSVMRSGRSTDSSQRRFLGRPAWQGDTLLFVPFPADWVREARPVTKLPSTDEAVRNQRWMLASLATAWIAADSSEAAFEAHAIALEMLEHPGASASLQHARDLAKTPEERRRIGIHQVWLQLKQSIPGDERGIRAARLRADSLVLSREPAEGLHEKLAGLAALTGRASLAADLAGAEDSSARRSRGSVVQRGQALVAFAALGGPTETLRQLEEQVHGLIQRNSPVAEGPALRQQWLARSATLAFPDIPVGAGWLVAGDDPLLDAQLELLAGRDAKARAYIAETRRGRASVSPAAISFDGLYPEAALLSRLGNDADAIAWLDPALKALPATGPLALANPAAAGTFVRAMALRADLAARTGDPVTARRWARAVEILWSDADEFLQPVVTRARSLSR